METCAEHTTKPRKCQSGRQDERIVWNGTSMHPETKKLYKNTASEVPRGLHWTYSPGPQNLTRNWQIDLGLVTPPAPDYTRCYTNTSAKDTIRPFSHRGSGRPDQEQLTPSPKIWSWGKKLYMALIFVSCLNKCIYHLHLGLFALILH